MKLYEFAPTRSIRARWTLQELDVEFEAIPVDLTKGEHRKPDFLRINPAGKIPAFIDGDVVLSESVAICLYLADKYPEKKLAPTDTRGRAELNRWLLFTVTELEQPLWRIARNSFVYNEADRQPKDVELARREFREMAAVMEKHMQDRHYVVGNAISIADFVLAYTLDWASIESLLDGFPVLSNYMERMYARPRAAMRITEASASIGFT